MQNTSSATATTHRQSSADAPNCDTNPATRHPLGQGNDTHWPATNDWCRCSRATGARAPSVNVYFHALHVWREACTLRPRPLVVRNHG